MPQTIEFESRWLLTRDQVPDNIIVILYAAPQFFVGYYVDDLTRNQSEFRINLWERELSLLQMVQFDYRTRYWALHVGVAGFTDPGWSGSWGDVTHPRVGRFTMSRV